MKKIKKTSAKFIKIIKKLFKFLFRQRRIRSYVIFGLAILLITTLAIVMLPYMVPRTYSLGEAEGLLSNTSDILAKKIEYNSEDKLFSFNNGQALDSSESTQTGASQIAVKAYENSTKGIIITDSTNQIDFSMTPEYDLKSGKQNSNRIIYPLTSGLGWTIYTMLNTGVKEDIVLTKSNSDSISFKYSLNLGDNLEAKIEADGGIGIYGNTLLSGSIATSTEDDATLLKKARENATKDTMLFTIPKPTILGLDQKKSTASATYSLNGKILTINVTNLNTAEYPLTIDPSIYVVTAQQFMAGNNETNIDFDVSNKLIKKSATTGARFDEWKNTLELPVSSWGAGVVAAGGYIYTAGGTSFSGQVYSTQGSDNFTVPTGITSITFKMWGGGGGGGGGGYSASGANGGGGGYVAATITVTPGETLTIYVGGGGGGGAYNSGGNDAGGGGGGGGYSSIYRGSTLLAIAAGGGGGGGARNALTGGAGGAGGGTSGIAGTTVGYGGGGGGGKQSAGGGGGTNASGNDGSAGSYLTGGDGADGRTSDGTDGSGAIGGLASGGSGGRPNINTTRSGGGGGGAGYYGGGGGAAARNNNADAGGGGGGGSSYTISSATSVTNSAGSGANPGNSSDLSRNGAATGGSSGAALGNGSTGANGLISISYGSGTTVSQSVNWAKFNTSTGEIESANPGSGTCSGWCTTAAYNLPSARTNFSMVAYNGFLYAIGGKDISGTRQSNIYIAKLGANGEPQLWHPTDTNKNNWTYWYQDTGLSSVRSDMTAIAYNNRIYIMGGISASSPVSTVEVADILPTGKLGSWATSTSLPTSLYGHSSQVYNDSLYVMGGAVAIGGATTNSVYYAKINSNGTLNNWIKTTSFSTGRISNGGNLSVIWGAYIYISGGCTAVNVNNYCTSVASDTQVASINADGSLDTWNTIAGVVSQRMGFGMIAWRNDIYEIGGCSTQDASTGSCGAATLSTIVYGSINQDGDASTVNQSVASGTSTCSGTSPTDCNLPGTTYVGNMLSGTVIVNGYLYVIGGCTNNACTTTSGNVAYVAISSTGETIKPATCPSGTYQGSIWCVDTTHTISGGIAATSPVVFNNRIYLIGGLDGSGNTGYLYRTDINSDGSIGAWTSQTLSSLGVNSVSFLYAYARSNPSAASTYPGNLYIFGGCTNSSGAGCTAYGQYVYKCNIAVAGTISSCSTSGQLQIGTIKDDTEPGLGVMSGTVYANYIYLIGGVSPNLVDITTIRYAKFDDNNNVVAASGSTWIQSNQEMLVGRRRAAAFGYNGYIYVVGGYDATAGVLADIEFVKVNVSDGSLGTSSEGFNVSSVTINQRWGLSVPISNSFAYVIGGCTVGSSPSGCTTRTDVIQTFQIYNNDSGAPAGYTTSASTYDSSPNRIGTSAVILNGYIYVAGGCTGITDCTATTDNVSYASIDVNGNIGTWSTTTAALPSARAWGQLETAGGSLYYIGGQSDTSTDRRTEIYYSTPTTGNITSWAIATNGLPLARTKFGSAVWNNRIYIVGGEGTGTSCTTNNVCNDVYVSPQLNSGGDIRSAWSTSSTAFDVARSGLAVVAYANNLYLFGGFDGTNYLSDTQYTQIDTTNGTVGEWTFSSNLPRAVSQADAFAANGYIYLLGGRSSTTNCVPSTLIAPVSANTTIASGNNPTGIGEWYETNQRYSGNRYGAAAVYYEGKAYIIGGGCDATLTYANPVIQQTTLLSQPQVAKYSIMIDTDSDVFPNYWLLNGVDNSIGAKWQLKYQSMTDTATSCVATPMTTWGRITNFGNVTLGLPGVYTPLDTNGSDTNCARYFYFNVTIDSSQAYGYPDDVTRGPTITDITLQFTSDPSKRLMHGRTFTGGLQQPLDTTYYSY